MCRRFALRRTRFPSTRSCARNPAFLAETGLRRNSSLESKSARRAHANYERLLGEVVHPRRFNLLLFGAFAALAFLLAIVGMHNVVAYSVSAIPARKASSIDPIRAIGSE